jgi:hypothetical protein
MRIYAALRNAGIAFEAHVIGDGPLRPELERLAGQQEESRWLGNRLKNPESGGKSLIFRGESGRRVESARAFQVWELRVE